MVTLLAIDHAPVSPDQVPAQDRLRFGYRPALDGMRALAVLAVLLFHGGVSWLPGGFLGVDAFFVLSGFLITSLLLAEHTRTGDIRLGAFWIRRARRLLPALVLVVVAVVLAYRDLLADHELSLLRGDALAALGYLANWRMIYRGDDYFTRSSTPSPLQHAWSLGIEEQFYLLWPLIVVALLLLTRTLSRTVPARRVLLALCVAGAATSAVAAAVLYRPLDVNRAYFGTDARAQALLIGCAVAVLLSRRLPRTWLPRSALGVAGLLVIGWLWSHADGNAAWLYRGGFALGGIAVARRHRPHHAQPARPDRTGAGGCPTGVARPDLVRGVPVALAAVRAPQRGTHRPARRRTVDRAARGRARRRDGVLCRSSRSPFDPAAGRYGCRCRISAVPSPA